MSKLEYLPKELLLIIIFFVGLEELTEIDFYLLNKNIFHNSLFFIRDKNEVFLKLGKKCSILHYINLSYIKILKVESSFNFYFSNKNIANIKKRFPNLKRIILNKNGYGILGYERLLSITTYFNRFNIIFYYDDKVSIYEEELIQEVFHPIRIIKYIEQGYDIDFL